MTQYPPTPTNPNRGQSPLYGLVSTKNIKGRKVTYDTKGNTEGYDQVTVKLGSNHGGIQVTLRENGDFKIRLVPWQSNVIDDAGKAVLRGTKRQLAKGNLRDLEDVYGKDGKGQQMPIWEQVAHEEYAQAELDNSDESRD